MPQEKDGGGGKGAEEKRMRETVLYYNTENPAKARLVKGVMIRLGIRIKNVLPEQTGEAVGYLAGMEGFEAREAAGEVKLPIGEEMLVLHNFGQRRLDELLREMRRAKASVPLKAIITQHNCSWSFYELYGEIKKEHEMMSQGTQEREGGAYES